MKIIGTTKISDTATGYRVHIDAEDLNHEETPSERYNRYLNQALRDTEHRGNKPEAAEERGRTATEKVG